VLWYTGETFGFANITTENEQVLRQWLDLGNRTLILSSENYMYDRAGSWTDVKGDAFVSAYFGIVGGAEDDQSDAPFPLTGVSMTPTAGLSLTLGVDQAGYVNIDTVNLDGGAIPLVTDLSDPGSTGTPHAVPCASIIHGIGAMHSSTAEYIGFPLINLIEPDAGFILFDALSTAAGLH
jgi:hypothetical protein